MIQSFTSKFLDELKEKVQNDDKLVGAVFIKYVPFFKCYTKYFADYEQSCALIKQLMKKPDFEAAALQQKKSSGGLDLESLLITPVQRIPRYKLLLSEILKHTPEAHPDYALIKKALEEVSKMGIIVNESVSEGQRSKQQDSIVQQYPPLGNYISASRKFKREIQKAEFSIGQTKRSKGPKTREGLVLIFTDMIFCLYKKKLMGAYDISSCYIKSKPETVSFVTPVDEVSIKAQKEDLKFLQETLEEGIEKFSVSKAKSI